VTALLHVLGFLTASALYVMLAAMTLGERAGVPGPRTARRSDLIPLATAALGLVWNVGELVMYGPYATSTAPPASVVLIAFGALSFLPAVVVHSALTGVSGTQRRRGVATLIASAYGVSVAATILNVANAFAGGRVPSRGSFLVLSVGFAAVLMVFTINSARQSAWRRTLPVAAVAAFAVMLAHRTAGSWNWSATTGRFCSSS